MPSVDEGAGLACDVAALRALIDGLLDEGRRPDDPILIAAAAVLRDKLSELRGQVSEQGR